MTIFLELTLPLFTTTATSGNISTQYFGDKFDIDKVEDIHLRFDLFTGHEAIAVTNTTLLVNIEENRYRENVYYREEKIIKCDIEQNRTECCKQLDQETCKASFTDYDIYESYVSLPFGSSKV